MKEKLLVLADIHPPTVDALEQRYELLRYDRAEDKEKFLTGTAPTATAGVTRGDYPVNAALLERLPGLKVLASYGVGYDGIDVAAASRLGIAVTNTPDVLSGCVADMVFALLLATVRRVVVNDRFVRTGQWEKGPSALTDKVWGEELGIIGLGRIGMEIAARAAGFRMNVSYCNRTPRADVPYRYYRDPVELARNVKFLAVMIPGGTETAGTVNRAVIDALGPGGYLINASRGSTVDEEYMIDALANGRLAGAGLDVFATSPRIPEALKKLDNVVLSPHAGSATVHTRMAMGAVLMDNVAAHFAGAPLPTRVN